MKEHRAKFVIELAVLTLVALPLLGIAQAPPRVVNTGAEQTNVTSIEDVQDVATRVVGWAQVFFYITATLFIVFAAFRYLTSGGDEEKVNGAKQMLIYAIVAIAIAAIAGGVVLVVRNFINA